MSVVCGGEEERGREREKKEEIKKERREDRPLNIGSHALQTVKHHEIVSALVHITDMGSLV